MAIPNQAQLDSIPLARAGEFDLNERETRLTRQRLYSINKAGFKRYRTTRDGSLLLVWRVQ